MPVATPPAPLGQPIHPADAARLDRALSQLEGAPQPARSSARGCAFFVLLSAAVLFVFLLLFMSAGEPRRVTGPSETAPSVTAPSVIEPSAAEPSAADTPVEAPSGR